MKTLLVYAAVTAFAIVVNVLFYSWFIGLLLGDT